ncbi:MAG: GAF domain-containing protein [Deltaproteobacteria bacterium]|nr:GAF domain-containing protein [Deltaproteobacteria bacterium]
MSDLYTTLLKKAEALFTQDGLSLVDNSQDGEVVLVLNRDGGKVLIVSKEIEHSHSYSNDESIPVILISDNEKSKDSIFYAVYPIDFEPRLLVQSINNAARFHLLTQKDVGNEKNLKDMDFALKELIEIGKNLNSYTNIDKLLEVILTKSRQLMGADAGSIYSVDETEDGSENLNMTFRLVQNDSVDVMHSQRKSIIPMTTLSIAGASAKMKRSINIKDVRKIPKDAPYKFNPSWDENNNYRTVSVFAVPMINQSGEVMGVIQLINKKRNPSRKLVSPDDFDNEVVEMDAMGRELVETLAGQAGISMENTRLYGEIKKIFTGFIKASVHAIEQRDPTTSGHSFRVAALTRELARAVSNHNEGTYKDVKFSEDEIKEIETAGLLHDFGKVGVREEVLVKAKKLYPTTLEVIRNRLNFIRTAIENDHLQRRVLMMEDGTPKEELSILDAGCQRAIDDIDECWRIINTANEPTVLDEGDFEKVKEVADRTFFDMNGKRRSYLTPEEVNSLLVAKGSLTPEEFDEIRSHAAHTISFLEKIPWGKGYKNIPKYAGCHHEKLDGSGYPNKLTDKEIPLPSKLMAIADIYDALTASDRPYKKAVSIEKAFKILDYEVKDNHIDGEILEIFKKNEIYKIVENCEPASLIEQ